MTSKSLMAILGGEPRRDGRELWPGRTAMSTLMAAGMPSTTISGKFYSGDIIDLGDGNLLTNAGNLSPGGPWSIQTTVLTGDLLQTPVASIRSTWTWARPRPI